MCGRFTLISSPDTWPITGLANHLPGFAPRYNIAPGQNIAVIRAAHDGSGPELVPMRWGFVPHWVREDRPRLQPINARAETAAEKPMFRQALSSHRCLIPASGFYEWQGRQGAKQPWYIRANDSPIMLFAGIHDHFSGTGEPIDTVAILTRNADAQMAPIHERMPVMVSPQQVDDWFGPGYRNVLNADPATPLASWPVSTRVNNTRNTDDGLTRPLET